MLHSGMHAVDPTERIAQLEEEKRALLGQIHAQRRLIEHLEQRIQSFLRKMWGPSSERLSPDQLKLAFAEDQVEPTPPEDMAPDDEEALEPEKKRKRGHGRAPLPKDLPRERVEHEPAAEDLVCACCGETKCRIGEETSEELEYVPASMLIVEHVRGKYACRKCEDGVVIADPPVRPLEKGRAGPGLLAKVVVAKYGDHLPLKRLEGIFARHGVHLARSTMCDWVRDVAGLLAPIVKEMRRGILSTGLVQTDDTPVKVQTGGPRTKRGFIWVYHAPERGEVVYDFTRSRARDGPERILRHYQGYLQADAYSGYDRIMARRGVVEVGCWAHARRKFVEAMDSSPDHATAVVAAIRRLYMIERQARELSPEDRQAVREERARPILATMEEGLELLDQIALPQSPLGKAVTYARNQWPALTRYVEDGRLPIDNNAAERTMRRVAVGRKNWLFAGSPAGGERAAVLYSLVESCRLAQVEPFAYLRDVISRVATHPMSRIGELTPRGWKAARADAS
jgi:transposase